ncbi:MAG: bile acid:sodium symporter family protein [Deltaproteobacteria bacterium]|nr:bile acid:sodium symporter family protein [Deltaproteobacteria bacterium]
MKTSHKPDESQASASTRTRRRITLNGPYLYILFLMVAVGLAWVVPEAGARGGWLRTETTTRLAVFVIFILQGLTLPTRELKRGLAQYRVHAWTEGFIFLFIPALTYLLLFFFRDLYIYDLYMGFLFLAALPSTISTSVVYTTQSGGATAVALFNASVSNVLAVFLVPVWISWQITARVPLPPVGTLILKIALIVLLPLIIGQMVRQWVRTWADRNKKVMSNVSMGLILFIVFAAFCNSVKQNTWHDLGLEEILLGFFSTLILLILIMSAGAVCRKVGGFRRDDGIAFFFSSTQKALSTGVPMATAIFASTGLDLALILVPLMFYHPLQLLIGSIVVGRFAAGKTREGAP